MTTRQDYNIVLRAQNATALAFRSLQGDIRATQNAARALMAAFGIGFGLRGVRDAVKSLADLNDQAKRTGTTTDAYQALQVTLEKNAGSAEDAARSMEYFGTEAAKAAAGGNSALGRVLRDNNVALRDQHGNVRDSAELLVEFARLVENAGSHSEKLGLAAAAFGQDAGPKMLGALSKIAHEGLPSLIEKGKQAGDIIDKDLIERGAKLEDAWKDLSRTASIEFRKMVVDVIGGSTDAGDSLLRFRDTLRGIFNLIRENIELIERAAGAFAGFSLGRKVGGPMGGLVGAVLGTMSPELRKYLERQGRGGLELEDTGNPFFGGGEHPPLGGPRTNTSGLAKARPDGNRSAEILATLRAEGEQLTFNLDQRRAAELVEQQINLVRRAGVDASEKDKAAIMGAAAALQQKKIAFEEAKDAAEALKGVVSDVFDIIFDRSKDAGEELLKMLRMLAIAELKAQALRLIDPSSAAGPVSAIAKGLGPLLGMGGFGGAGNPTGYAVNPFSAGGLLGGRAEGGPARAGQPIWVGEKGRKELFVPDTNGTVMPLGGMTAGRQTVRIELVNGSGQPVPARDGGQRDEGGVPVQTIIVGEVAQDIAMGGSIAQLIERQYGVTRRTS